MDEGNGSNEGVVMVVRKKGKLTEKAARKSGRQAESGARYGAAKRQVKKAARKAAKKAPARRSVKPVPASGRQKAYLEIAKDTRLISPKGQQIIIIKGVPMSTVSLVYLALSQMRGILYGLAQAYHEQYGDDELKITFKSISGVASADELNKISGHRCDDLILDGEFTENLPFSQVLMKLRDWLLNCMEALIPPEETEIVDE